ncbi:MAG: hypothetical protein JW776_00255 [Candidatus Lokiarchaeota archaeon]|nr:hypothetical protein [Candidatus Lokiarchaeota archaeon]
MIPEFPNDRDYFYDEDDQIYQVLGYVHPRDTLYCLQKYEKTIEDQNIFFWKSDITHHSYKRLITQYSSSTAASIIESHPYREHSELYGSDFIQYPKNKIKFYLSPRKKLEQLIDTPKSKFHSLAEQEKLAVEIAHVFENELNIPLRDMGITGSILWGGIHKHSDIDLIIYGKSNLMAFLYNIHRLVNVHSQLRTPTLMENVSNAHKFSQKSGMSIEDCTVFITNKPFLLFFSKFYLSMAFNPSEQEIQNNTLALDSTYFINVPEYSRMVIQATVVNDDWLYYYPGVVYLDDVHFVGLVQGKVSSSNLCRALIFEHENIGYYKRGNRIEICGLLQQIQNPPHDIVARYSGKNPSSPFFQLVIGTRENYGNEYVKNLEM